MDRMYIEDFRQKSFEKRIKKLRVVSYHYLKKCKEYLKINKNTAVFYIMLTFRDMNEFINAKNQVKSAIGRYIFLLKQRLSREGHKLYTYFWVLEKQSRGVPHYHVFLVSDKNAYIPYPDRSYWSWGFSGLKRVGINQISKNYLAKYLYKQEQKDYRDIEVFKGLNMYGFYVCDELKEYFFDVLVRRYSFFRYMLSKKLNKFIKKARSGYIIDDGVEVKLKCFFAFLHGMVYMDFEGVEVRVDSEIVYFEDFSGFWEAIEFIYDDMINFN